MRNFKTKIRHSIVDSVVQMIDKQLQQPAEDMDDKLVMAGLAEVRLIMLRKMLKPQFQYSFTLTPVQAIAIDIWFTDYLGDWSCQTTAHLHQISNQIKQTYA